VGGAAQGEREALEDGEHPADQVKRYF